MTLRLSDRVRFLVLPLAVLAAGIVALSMQVAPARAQNFGGAFEGMRDSDQPVEIEADRLEVVDKEGYAIFDGNVNVVQGTTILKTKRLKVYYEGGAAASQGPAGNVRRIEATGKVAVRSNDQVATADAATVDMLKQEAVLSGNVSVSQGANIVTGCLLTIDLATNAATLEPCKAKSKTGRVKMMITPSSRDKALAGEKSQ